MLLQVQRVSTVISCTETQWENAIEKSKNAIQMRVRIRVRARVQAQKIISGKLNGRTWSSGYQKRIKTTIKQYTMRSDAQRVIEQNDSLI